MKTCIILKCAEGEREREGGSEGGRERQVIQHKEPTGIWAFPLQ